MTSRTFRVVHLRGRSLLVLIAALCSLPFGGCGGQVSGAECSFFSNVCNPTIGTQTFFFAFVDPVDVTVTVGGSVTFVGTTTGPAPEGYRWQRSSDGGSTYVDIPGANQPIYVLAGASLPDDGAYFLFTARSGADQGQARARLHVSSMPAVIYQDAEFDAADWSATAIAEPTVAGPTHDEAQAITGGNPGAYRTMTHRMPAGPSTLTVFHASVAATYDPPTQGVIYRIDYQEDCAQPDSVTSNLTVTSALLLEQSGRRYIADAYRCVGTTSWAATIRQRSLDATRFVLAAGPPCASGEACPDFSATAAPLRFGYARSTTTAAAAPAVATVHGIDNWKVTVWRR